MSLREEALGIIDELQLMKLLNDYGEARLVGSVALDLIVKLDIDIHLLIKGNLIDTVNSIYPRLLDHAKVHEVRLTDFRQEGAIKVGIDEYQGLSGVWSIDIWVTDNPNTLAWDDVKKILSSLDDEKRKAILRIKRHYFANDLLRDSLSTEIYHAVINHGVREVEDFESWRKKSR